MIDKEALLAKIDAAQKVIDGCGVPGLQIDSANFQTKSKEDFEKYASQFENESSKFLLEVNHAGRRIQVFDVIDETLGLNYVEVSEPKPSSKLLENHWEYVSYVSSNYDACLSKAQGSKYKVDKIREINGTRLFYLVTPEVLIQVRNKSISEIEPVEDFGGEGLDEQASEESEPRLAGQEAVVSEPDYKEKYARLMADFDNYRRIQEQQAATTAVSGKLRLFGELIEVLDDFGRAIAAHPEVANGGVDGFQAIYDKVVLILKENGVEEVVVSVGDQFNSMQMEAVTTIPTPDQAGDNTVQEVLQKGYVHRESGKVVRMPRVVVAKFGN